MAGGGGGSVDVHLQRALEHAGAVSARNAEGLTGSGQPAYNNYVSPEESGPERFDRKMETVFNFENMINEFGSSGEDTTLGGVAFMQSQYALLAQMARDQRLRKRTRLAQLAHAATRLKSFDTSMNGPTLSRTQLWLAAGDAQ